MARVKQPWKAMHTPEARKKAAASRAKTFAAKKKAAKKAAKSDVSTVAFVSRKARKQGFIGPTGIEMDAGIVERVLRSGKKKKSVASTSIPARSIPTDVLSKLIVGVADYLTARGRK